MYINSGYLHHSRLPIKDKTKPLIVSSCGTYRLSTHHHLPTWRPRGRLDYQLLYVAAGKAHFIINGTDQVVTAGHMVLYLPRQEQHYIYYGKDKPEIYWVHFTGSDVKNILRKYQIPITENIFYCDTSSTYTLLFKEIISELQTCRIGYQELLTMYLRQIFMQVQRSHNEQLPSIPTYIREQMESARRYFSEHYSESITIEDYAHKSGMSVSWFLRNFRQITGQSPMQYIISIRIHNACNLLLSTDYNITEIASLVGYDNPLYFSRLFHKLQGLSPSDYRKFHNAKDQKNDQ